MGRWTYAIAEELIANGHDVDCWFEDDFPSLDL